MGMRTLKYLPPAGDNYLTRFDAVPGSYECSVFYYTTLDPSNRYAYVSDSAIIVNGTTIIGSTTNTDANNKLSDKHIQITGGNCTGEESWCPGAFLSIEFDMWGQNLPNIQIDGRNKDFNGLDLGYFYVFKAIIPGWTAKCRIKGQKPGGYDSNTTDFQISDCLVKNLNQINFSYYISDNGYMKGQADLYDTTGKIFITQTTGKKSKTFYNCTQN
jgi:hypothetical protein